MDLHRKPGESAESYELRMCGLKDVLNKKWDEIASIINDELGQDYSESRYRKHYARTVGNVGNSQTLGTGLVLDTDALDQMTQAKVELQMERQKIQAEKLELSRQLRIQSRFENFYDKVASVVKTLPLPDFYPLPASDNDKEYVLAISDIHYGSTFESENNCYSRQIAKERLEDLCGQVIDFVQKNDLTHLYVLSLGDSLQGLLRYTDLNLNDIPVVDCVVEISRILAQFLNELSSYCQIDFYAVSAANHTQTRPLGSKANELATEDLERVIISYISDMLVLNDRVSVHTDLSRDYVSFDIFDNKCIALHGHQISNLSTAIKDYSGLHQCWYSVLFCGHFHAGEELIVGERDGHNVEVLVAPGIVGSDPYSDKLRKGAKSAARIYGFDREFGHTTTETFILN